MMRGCFRVAVLVGSLLLSLLSNAQAGMSASLRDQLRRLDQGIPPAKLIGGAQFRVAVFAYEDKDATGLGNAIAHLLAHEILMNSGVSSLGVLMFRDDLSPTEGVGLSYFDKVERVGAAQDVTLAVWGKVRRERDELVVDTYLQIPAQTLQRYFGWELKLPEQMGGGRLLTHIKPDRVRVQTLRVPSTTSKEIGTAAARLRELRKRPESHSQVVATVPADTVYRVVSRKNNWINVKADSGEEGWVPARSHCRRACDSLVQAGTFAGAITRYAESQNVPLATRALGTEALAVAEQLQAIEGLQANYSDEVRTRAVDVAGRWVGQSRQTGKDPTTGIERGSGTPPGGAAFANVRAVGEIVMLLQDRMQRLGGMEGPRAFETLELERHDIDRIAFELAEASQYDPYNLDVLHNLAVLFEYVGDKERSQLARTLATAVARTGTGP